MSMHDMGEAVFHFINEKLCGILFTAGALISATVILVFDFYRRKDIKGVKEA